jgi:hypothetical protein
MNCAKYKAGLSHWLDDSEWGLASVMGCGARRRAGITDGMVGGLINR